MGKFYLSPINSQTGGTPVLRTPRKFSSFSPLCGRGGLRGRCRSDLVNAIVRSFFENHLFRLAQYRREKKSLFNNYNPESHA